MPRDDAEEFRDFDRLADWAVADTLRTAAGWLDQYPGVDPAVLLRAGAARLTGRTTEEEEEEQVAFTTSYEPIGEDAAMGACSRCGAPIYWSLVKRHSAWHRAYEDRSPGDASASGPPVRVYDGDRSQLMDGSRPFGTPDYAADTAQGLGPKITDVPET